MLTISTRVILTTFVRKDVKGSLPKNPKNTLNNHDLAGFRNDLKYVQLEESVNPSEKEPLKTITYTIEL